MTNSAASIAADPALAALDLGAAPHALPDGEAKDSLARTQRLIETMLPPGSVEIYEAGGGSSSVLPPSVLARARVTVVDLDPVQVANNRYGHRTIQGDVQAQEFPKDSFDLVVCYNVIEHLPDVEAALRRFAACVRPGGLILIGAPNPRSLSGVVTRFSPHWFHVWYYRRIRGNPRAGEPGEAPFRTHYHPLVTPSRLRRFAATLGFETALERLYESPRYPELRERHPRLARLVDLGAVALNAVLLNRVDVRRGDYHLVLRRP